MNIHAFSFNPYQENTYLIWDDAGHTAIIDPGCYTAGEQIRLRDFIAAKNLTVTHHLLTHGHIDHVVGCEYVQQTYNPVFVGGNGVEKEIAMAEQYGPAFGLSVGNVPRPQTYVGHGDTFHVGSLELEVIFTPGHSAAHISYYHRASKSLFSGDVLFAGSIGRTDLPGGNRDTLMDTIFNVLLLPLGGGVDVYPGHGPSTTLETESRTNPFLLEWA